MRKLLLSIVLCLPLLSNANVLGSFQTFSPTADQFYFETVNSSKTLQPGWVILVCMDIMQKILCWFTRTQMINQQR